jgi:hypothetical protein
MPGSLCAEIESDDEAAQMPSGWRPSVPVPSNRKREDFKSLLKLLTSQVQSLRWCSLQLRPHTRARTGREPGQSHDPGHRQPPRARSRRCHGQEVRFSEESSKKKRARKQES